MGQTDLLVNRICLGTGSFGGSTPESDCLEQLDYFRSIGGVFLDTALAYCDWLLVERSCSNKLLGRWMKDRGCRSEIILSAKGCHDKVIEPTGNALTCKRRKPQLHRQDIIHDIEETMEYLQTDYLDIFTLHKDNPEVAVSEILETLQEQKKLGKIRWYGCSNWSYERQKEAYDYARNHHLDGFCVDQIGWCLNVQNVDSPSYKGKVLMNDDTYRFHQETQIPVMGFAASGRAYFHRLANQMLVREQEKIEYDNAVNNELLTLLQEAAKKTNAEVNTIVVNYLLLNHGFQTIPVIGVKTIEEFDICLAALEYQLPEEYEQKIRALTR